MPMSLDRLSSEWLRLSPITKTQPAGTFTGKEMSYWSIVGSLM